MSTNHKNKKISNGKALALFMLLALGLRLLAVLTRPMIQLDETAYVRMAENLMAGQGLLDISGLTSTHFSPLFPLFIATFSVVLRDYVVSAYAVVILFGTLMLVPTYLLGKELVGSRVGLLAAALLAVTPLFVDYSSRLYSESVYIFFLLLAVLFGFHMLRGCRWLCGAVAGVSLGLAYLANPSAIFYLLALVALGAMVALKKGAYRQMARALAVFLLCFGLYAVPYVIYLHGELGQWTYSGKVPGNIYAASHNLRHGTLDWEKDLLSLTTDKRQIKAFTLTDEADPFSNFLRHPVQGAKIFAEQSFIFYSQELPQVLPLWLLPLLGLGLFAYGWSRQRAVRVGYLLVMMAPAILILTMYAHSRFFMPFLPLALIWVGEGWLKLEQWGGETAGLMLQPPARGRWQARAPWLVGAAVLLPLVAFAAVTVLKPSYPLEYKQAGELIRQESGGGQRILSREYSSAYYAGGTALLLPYASYEDTIAYARNQGIDYLVISRQQIFDWRPTLAKLLEGNERHPEWRLVGSVPGRNGSEALVFKLDD